MKYEKPIIVISDITTSKSIASTGLSEWLETSGYDASVENHITTYEVNS